MELQPSEREADRQSKQREASNAAQVKPSLSVVEAARRTGVSVAYLNRLRSSGGGPVYQKIGRRVTYAPDDIDEWLAASRRRSTAEIAA